jgi:hypothetical protein
MANNQLLGYGMVGFGLCAFRDRPKLRGTARYFFEERDHGHISTRQIQRLLDGVAKRAGLPKDTIGQYERKKEVYVTSFGAQLQQMIA